MTPEITADSPITDFPWSGRARKCLSGALAPEIVTLRDLSRLSEPALLRIPNFGKVTLAEIKTVLAQFGLSLSFHDPHPFSRCPTCGSLINGEFKPMSLLERIEDHLHRET